MLLYSPVPNITIQCTSNHHTLVYVSYTVSQKKIFTGKSPVLKLLLLAIFWRLCAPIIVIFGREEATPTSYSLPELKIIGGHLVAAPREEFQTAYLKKIATIFCGFWRSLSHQLQKVDSFWMTYALWSRESFLPVLHCLSSAMHFFTSLISLDYIQWIDFQNYFPGIT